MPVAGSTIAEVVSSPGTHGKKTPSSRRNDLLILALLTLAALLVHGYHPGSEDSETYLPGVEKMLHPELFPVGSQYFLLHSHMTFFPNLIAASVRLTHLPLEWALFLWHVLSIFLFLTACRELMKRSFADLRAQWCGVALIAVLLTLPVSGTALYIMDQYVNPRNLIAFAVVFAIVRVLDRKYLQAVLFLLFAAAIHPFMTVFAASFCALLAWMERTWVEKSSGAIPESALAAAVPLDLFKPPSQAYESVSSTHRYQYLARWRWYEFLGALAPLAILYWFRNLARDRKLRNLEIMCGALIVYGGIYFAAGMVVSVPHRLALISRLQPMRSLYLLYLLFFLFMGGFLGQFVLKAKLWRWIVLSLPLCAGMFIVQRSLFPASPHVEWPWMQPRNPWAQAFTWVRNNTPNDAVFAIDPFYMRFRGEDANGFRAIAQRSQLADAGKDSGVVELFPQIGDEWLAQVQAQTGLDEFQLKDMQRLQSQYGVSWVVLRRHSTGGLLPADAQLACPYQNDAVRICRLQ